jgi:hypothetical protein
MLKLLIINRVSKQYFCFLVNMAIFILSLKLKIISGAGKLKVIYYGSCTLWLSYPIFQSSPELALKS